MTVRRVLLWLGSIALTMSLRVAWGLELQDPTQPSGMPSSSQSVLNDDLPAQASPLVLHSIIMGRARRVAVVNGRLLGVGDAIDQHTVVAIDDSSVTLERAGEALTLHLRKRVIQIRAPKP